jgi:hypothetical protein
VTPIHRRRSLAAMNRMFCLPGNSRDFLFLSKAITAMLKKKIRVFKTKPETSTASL